MESKPLGYQTPEVIWRYDGVPAEVHQYDDHIALHRTSRHREGSRGALGRCTNRQCDDLAVIDKFVANQYTGAWRAICAAHGYKLAQKVSVTISPFITQMVDVMVAALREKERTH